jgi:hypothetical protein
MSNSIHAASGPEARAETLAHAFAQLPGIEQYGLRRFPTASAYQTCAEEMKTAFGRAASGEIAVAAQRDWHVRGQNGCMFARLAAKDALRVGWRHLPLPDHSARTIGLAAKDIESAISDADAQIVSVLFPDVRSADEAIAAVRALVAHGGFTLEVDATVDQHHHFHVRYPVVRADAPVVAWVMAFGPFPFMPNTRRAPFFELAVRVKEKPDWLFHRLNPDRAIAHLADVPLEMSDKHWEHRWASTLRRTRMILGSEPDELSAAKCTLAVPSELIAGTRCTMMR